MSVGFFLAGRQDVDPLGGTRTDYSTAPRRLLEESISDRVANRETITRREDSRERVKVTRYVKPREHTEKLARA